MFCPKDGTRLVARAPVDLVGTIIADRYRITRKLGGGGMGDVYLAEHIRIKRLCAVKVLRQNLSGDAAALQRFEREAENASLLSHPNVAQVYDFGEHGDLVYLAMEFIEGESMAEFLKRQPVMHPDEVADIITQSASALDAAHARSVLHRDVKPDNIMLAKNPDGTFLAKLVDFGIARAMASEDQRVTQTGFVIGTPEYMSPEQIAGESLDLRSDLYSLALVAFQALTGQSAFPNTSSMESLIARLTSRPRTLVEALQSVKWPQSVQDVFDKALAPQREERYESSGEFATELATAIGEMTPTETAEFYRHALESRAGMPGFPPASTPGRAVPTTPSYSAPIRQTPSRTTTPTVSHTAAAIAQERLTMPMPTPATSPVVGPWSSEPARAPRRRRATSRVVIAGVRRLVSYAFIVWVVYIVATGKTQRTIEKVKDVVRPVLNTITGGGGGGSRADATADSLPASESDGTKTRSNSSRNKSTTAKVPESNGDKGGQSGSKPEPKPDDKQETKPADTTHPSKPPVVKPTPPDTTSST